MIWIELIGGPFHGQWREIDERLLERVEIKIPTPPNKVEFVSEELLSPSVDVIRIDRYRIRKRDLPPEFPVEWIGVHETLL